VRVFGYVIARHLPWVLISFVIMIALIVLVRNQMKSTAKN
jgi:hypothetical protein